MKEAQKTLLSKKDIYIRKTGFKKRQKMVTDVVFQSLTMLDDCKARNQKKVLKGRNTRKGTIKTYDYILQFQH